MKADIYVTKSTINHLFFPAQVCSRQMEAQPPRSFRSQQGVEIGSYTAPRSSCASAITGTSQLPNVSIREKLTAVEMQ